MLTRQEYQALIQAVPAFRHAHKGIQIEDEQSTVAVNISRTWVEANATDLGKEYYYLLKKALRVAVGRNHDDGYRYPIVKQHHEYLRIVSDPINNRSIWMNRAEIPQYRKSAIMFDYINENQWPFFDIFYLINYQNRVVYAAPNLSAKKPFFDFKLTNLKRFRLQNRRMDLQNL